MIRKWRDREEGGKKEERTKSRKKVTERLERIMGRGTKENRSEMDVQIIKEK